MSIQPSPFQTVRNLDLLSFSNWEKSLTFHHQTCSPEAPCSDSHNHLSVRVSTCPEATCSQPYPFHSHVAQTAIKYRRLCISVHISTRKQKNFLWQSEHDRFMNFIKSSACLQISSVDKQCIICIRHLVIGKHSIFQ